MSNEGAALDADRVSGLADRVEDAAESTETAAGELAVTVVASLTSAFTDTTVFGNTSSAEACMSSFQEIYTAGASAVDRLGKVLRTDAGRIRLVVRRVEEVDEGAADLLKAVAGGQLDIATAHVQSGSDFWNDLIRTPQINKAVDALGADPRSTIYTGDMNVDYDSEAQDGTLSANALRRLEEEQDFQNAGDDVGPTHGDEDQIDYVFSSSDLRPGDPDRVESNSPEDGFHSDHDGIILDVEIPPSW